MTEPSACSHYTLRSSSVEAKDCPWCLLERCIDLLRKVSTQKASGDHDANAWAAFDLLNDIDNVGPAEGKGEPK